MALATHQTIQSLWQRFVEDELGRLPVEQRRSAERQFEARFGDLLRKAGGDSTDAFVDLLGFGGDGIKPFGDIAYPNLEADFDESITPSQALACSQLYFIYQHDQKMGVFRAVAQLQKLFRDGRIQIQSGPGAQQLYTLLRYAPLRYSAKDRAIAYMRVFNYGRAPRPAGAVINKNFHYQRVALMSSLAQYFRDLTIGEVIRGSGDIEQRPYGSIATVQRLAIDLRHALDRASYGNIVAVTHETGLYLDQVLDLLDAPDVRNSFGVATRWALLEKIANLYFGGARELSQRAKMAEAGRRVLQWVTSSDFSAHVDPETFRAGAEIVGSQAEVWIAAYRLTEEGRRFPGVSTQLKWSFGLSRRREEAEELV